MRRLNVTTVDGYEKVDVTFGIQIVNQDVVEDPEYGRNVSRTTRAPPKLLELLHGVLLSNTFHLDVDRAFSRAHFAQDY